MAFLYHSFSDYLFTPKLLKIPVPQSIIFPFFLPIYLFLCGFVIPELGGGSGYSVRVDIFSPHQVNPCGNLYGKAKFDWVGSLNTRMRNYRICSCVACLPGLTSHSVLPLGRAIWVWFGNFLPSYINIINCYHTQVISLIHLPTVCFLNHLVCHRVALLQLGSTMKEGFSFGGYQSSLGKWGIVRGSSSPWFSCYLFAFLFF